VSILSGLEEPRMPEKTTIERARRDRRAGKAPTTQAGEFVREEMEHAKRGKHPVKSRKQAIAIGLSKARRAGVDLPAPAKGRTSEKTRRSAKSARRRGRRSGALRSGSRSAARTASRKKGRGSSRSRPRSRSGSRSRRSR
jgi:hypothetical protein